MKLRDILNGILMKLVITKSLLVWHLSHLLDQRGCELGGWLGKWALWFVHSPGHLFMFIQ